MNRYTGAPVKKKLRSVEEIEKDIRYWLKQSNACPYCPDECWCDDDWSPASHLSGLRKELAEVERAGRASARRKTSK